MPLEQRRELLLRTAATMFAGPEGQSVSIDAIAAEAGVAKPAIYELFDSKQALYEAAVAAELAQLAEYMSGAHDAPSALPLVDRTRLRVEAVFTYVRENPVAMGLLLSATRHPTEAIASLQTEAREIITASLARAIGPELDAAGLDADEDGVLLLAAMSVESVIAAAILSLEHREWDLDAVTATATDFLLTGFAGLGGAALRLQQP
jgi:AcrR family transcriptional regulator